MHNAASGADTAWQAFGPGGRKTNDVPKFGPDPS